MNVIRVPYSHRRTGTGSEGRDGDGDGDGDANYSTYLEI